MPDLLVLNQMPGVVPHVAGDESVGELPQRVPRGAGGLQHVSVLQHILGRATQCPEYATHDKFVEVPHIDPVPADGVHEAHRERRNRSNGERHEEGEEWHVDVALQYNDEQHYERCSEYRDPLAAPDET